MITAGVVSPQERWRVHKHAVNNVDSALNLLTGKKFSCPKNFLAKKTYLFAFAL